MLPVDFDALDGAPVDLLSSSCWYRRPRPKNISNCSGRSPPCLDRADVRDRLRSAPTAEALYQIVVDVQNGQ